MKPFAAVATNHPPATTVVANNPNVVARKATSTSERDILRPVASRPPSKALERGADAVDDACVATRRTRARRASSSWSEALGVNA